MDKCDVLKRRLLLARSCHIHKAGFQLQAKARNGQDSLPRNVLERGVSTNHSVNFPEQL